MPRPSRAAALPDAALAVPPHEALDLRLRETAKRLHLGAFELLETIREAIDTRVHEHFGFADESAYLVDRTGLHARSIYRQLAILDGLRALPSAEQAEARGVLAELGSHRAAVIAPALEREPADWREWAALARQGTEDALQEAVSSALGSKPRGVAKGSPSERFLKAVLGFMPPERHDQITWVLRQIAAFGDEQNTMSIIAAFLVMVDLAERDLADHGKVRK